MLKVVRKYGFSLVIGTFFFLPTLSYAQQMTGGGYTINGQVNPITGIKSGNGYSVQTGGQSASSLLQGGGYSVNAGSYFSNFPPAVVTPPGGGGGGGDGFVIVPPSSI